MDAPVQTEVVQIEADLVEWAAGVATAAGGVDVRFGDAGLSGRRATWNGTLLVVEDGEYRRPEGVLAFDRAEVTPAAGTAILTRSRVTLAKGRLDAEILTVSPEAWQATGADVVPCVCDDGGPPALTFSAARITVIPMRVVILRGGVARVFGVPVLPVPYARLPLDPHRFRVLLPEVGFGESGASAQVAGRGGIGDWSFQGGPAWRQDRGGRAELAITGPEGKLRGELGWDALEARVRGVAVSRGGVVQEGLGQGARLGWDVTAQSDPNYVADYAVDYVSRGSGWQESRVSFGWGPQRLDGWIPDDGSEGVLLRERLLFPIGTGPAAVTPRVGVALVGTTAAPAPLLELGAGARAVGTLGWVSAEVAGDVAGRYGFGPSHLDERLAADPTDPAPLSAFFDGLGRVGEGTSPWGDGLADAPMALWGTGGSGVRAGARGEVSVPVWSTASAARIQWWPGFRAETNITMDLIGDSSSVASMSDPVLTMRVGPSVRATTALATGGLGIDVALLQDGAGWRPAGSIDAHFTRLAVRAQADTEVQSGEIRWMPTERYSVAIGSAHASGLWLGWGDAVVGVGRFRTGGGLTWDLGGGAFSGADARVGYDDGCTAATLTARFAPDRVLPDFGLALVLRR